MEGNDIGFQELLNKAAKELPDGWQLEIRTEQGAAWVNLYMPNGKRVDVPADDVCASLAEEVLLMVTHAQLASGIVKD